MIRISASLLAADYARLGKEIQRAEKAGVDSFHFDMMDRHYVPNLALTPDHLKALHAYSHLPFHAHLELDNPDDILSKFASLQADMIIVQWNTLTDPVRTFDRIRSQNIKVGLGFNPDNAYDEAAHFFQDIDCFCFWEFIRASAGKPCTQAWWKRSHPCSFWQINQNVDLQLP